MDLKNMNYMQELIASRLLSQRTNDRGFHIIDALLDPNNPSVTADPESMNQEIKNVCAKVHVTLADRVDKVCENLDISKRVFLEAAMIQACDTFEAIWDDLGMDDFYTAQAEASAEAMEKNS